MDKLKIYVSGPDKALSPALIILTLIPSRPVDFPCFNFLILLSTYEPVACSNLKALDCVLA